MLGKRLGDFEITGEIGKGGMGKVYKARQISLDRDVAIKILAGNLSEVGEFKERFDVEAKAIASLVHENILQVYSKGVTDDGIHYFAMEYVDGEDLSEKIKRGVTFSEKEAIDIAIQISRGLEAAGSKNIIHRDIKPSNIMITKKGLVKIADFGLAKSLDVTKKITQTNMYMGTVAYTSPEQGEGKRLDQRTDIYSLGVVLYQLLTGVVPFDGETPSSVIYKHVYEAPPPPRSIKPGLSPEAEAAVLKAIAKKPEDRYQNATDFRKALEAVINAQSAKMAEGGAPKQAAVLPIQQQSSSQVKVDVANRRSFLIIVALIIVLLGGSALYASKYGYRALFSKVLPISKPEEIKVTEEIPQQPAVLPSQPEVVAKIPETAAPAENIGNSGLVPMQSVKNGRDIARYDHTEKTAPPENPGGTGEQTGRKKRTGMPAVVVLSSGEPNISEIVESVVGRKLQERSFPIASTGDVQALAERYGRHGIPLNALGQHRFKADILIYIKVSTMNAGPLHFYGRTVDQYASTISIKAIDTSTRKAIIAPASRTVNYTSLNMQDNVEEATIEMVSDMAGRLEAFWKP